MSISDEQLTNYRTYETETKNSGTARWVEAVVWDQGTIYNDNTNICNETNPFTHAELIQATTLKRIEFENCTPCVKATETVQ